MEEQKMRKVDEFLRRPLIAKIATVRPDGSPYVVPVIYKWDGQFIWVIGRKRSAWIEYIRREPRVAVLIDEPNPPHPRVLIEGEAEIVGTEWLELGKEMLERYMGRDLSQKYLEGTIDQPRWLIRITPKKITSWIISMEDAATKKTWHPRYYEPGTKWYEEYMREKVSKTRKT
jgi:PPOX class probable F420-dependent enzyme